MQPALGIIADDFTGAVMVAALLEGRGVHCPVLFRPDGLIGSAGSGALIAAARSRTIEAGKALTEIATWHEALTAAGCRRIVYKACATFDSTEAGNIGPAADFLASQGGRRPVLMSAGFPRYGATVHQGYLFYRTRLVSDSIKRLDPLTPMNDPDLVRFLGRQTPHRVGLVSHLTLAKGIHAVQAAVADLVAAGAGHVLFDASDDGDVALTADLAAQLDLPVVASDPLIEELAVRLCERVAAPPPPMTPPPSRVAVLAGSTGPVVLGQLEALNHPVLVLDLLDPRGPEDVVADALDWSARQAGSFAISTATDAQGLARSQAVHGAMGAARLAEDLLGRIVRGLHQRGLRRFVVAGGETSGAVVAALGLGAARALVEDGLGPGVCISQGSDPVWLFLKSGKLGSQDVLLRAIQRGEGTGP
jgi:uncharacterized protein YgbK (DUF1537 family)